MMRICLLIRALNVGGAQRQIMSLGNGLTNRGHTVTLAVFYPNGELRKLLDNKVKFVSLDKRNRWDLIGFFYRLVRFIQEEQPDYIYSFLEEANIIGVCLKLRFPKLRILWGVRHSFIDLQQYDWATWAGDLFERYLARFADQIIFNSHAGMNSGLAKGYPTFKSCVIPNGIETDYYRPNDRQRTSFREEWGIEQQEILIGIVGRLDPMKDHHNFLLAASELVSVSHNVRFIVIGDGPEKLMQELKRLSDRLKLGGRLIWAGKRSDMTYVYNALDILVSSSYGEGFSNVISEAMSCGIPCVVTDVGDSAMIVDDTGIVIPPRNSEVMTEALNRLVSQIQEIDHDHIRSKIVDRFSIRFMLDATENLLTELKSS